MDLIKYVLRCHPAKVVSGRSTSTEVCLDPVKKKPKNASREAGYLFTSHTSIVRRLHLIRFWIISKCFLIGLLSFGL